MLPNSGAERQRTSHILHPHPINHRFSPLHLVRLPLPLLHRTIQARRNVPPRLALDTEESVEWWIGIYARCVGWVGDFAVFPSK